MWKSSSHHGNRRTSRAYLVHSSPTTNQVYNSIPHHERENLKSLAEHQVHPYLTLLTQTTSSNAFHRRVCMLLGVDYQESKFLYSSLYPVTLACLHFCLLLDGGSVNVIYSTPQNVKNTNFAANTPIYSNNQALYSYPRQPPFD